LDGETSAASENQNHFPAAAALGGSFVGTPGSICGPSSLEGIAVSVVQHIKEMISSGATENADAWAAKWFAVPQRVVASGVAQLVIAIAGGDLDRLSAQTRFIEDLGLNELQRVQLVMAVEQQFNVELSDQDAEDIDTMAQLVEWVHAKTQVGLEKVAAAK